MAKREGSGYVGLEGGGRVLGARPRRKGKICVGGGEGGAFP